MAYPKFNLMLAELELAHWVASGDTLMASRTRAVIALHSPKGN